MEHLLIILVVLFVALLVLVPLIEKFGNKDEKPPNPKLMKWLFPLMALLLVMQLLRYYFG